MVTKRLIKGTCVNSKKVYYHYAHRDRIKRAAIKWLKKKKKDKRLHLLLVGENEGAGAKRNKNVN